MKEAGEEPGCVLGCLMSVFCAGSCVSVVAPELRPHLLETAHWRRHLIQKVCKEVGVEERRSHRWGVCWKTEAASRSWERWGLCWVSVGGASLCCERKMRKVEQVLSDWG